MKRFTLPAKATAPTVPSSYSYVIRPWSGHSAHGSYRVVVTDGVVTAAYRVEADGEIAVELALDQDGLVVQLEIDRQATA